MTAGYLFSLFGVLYSINWLNYGFFCLKHNGLVPSPLFSTPLHLFFFFSFASKSRFPLHLATDHTKPLIGMVVEGLWKQWGWRVIMGLGVSSSPAHTLKGCDWIPDQVKERFLSKKRFVCNHQAMIVWQSPCLICHNMLCHLLTSLIHLWMGFHHLATCLLNYKSGWLWWVATMFGKKWK